MIIVRIRVRSNKKQIISVNKQIHVQNWKKKKTNSKIRWTMDDELITSLKIV